MSGSQRSWVKFCVVAAITTFLSGILLLYLPNTASIWLAAAAIGILVAVVTASIGGVASSQVGSATAAINQNSPDEWSAEDWKSWAKQQADVLQAESEAVADRERRLSERLVRYHELLESPDSEASLHAEDDSSALSEYDRQVQQILEAKAAEVYEKIRTNAYVVEGKIDVITIRADVVKLIAQVARVYQPDSKQPLLETSFNNLARAFSRICLHCLALLEQLPLDVRNYTLSELFTYFQRATKAYGAYQMVSPWMKRLGRTAYAGRLAAGANPVTLGAWWLASEVAQRSTRHVVANVVDRRAIAVLHDLVSVVGTEVANIYGPGYRQRDAAWIYGSELTELLSRFPTSRESLRLALKEMTALPLKCEYDRIYLYRCLATSKPAGFLLSDSAALTREQREAIAVHLERFVNDVLHGIDDDVLQKWAAETESRLDLRLKLGQQPGTSSHSTSELASDSIKSIWGFCVSILNADTDRTMQQIESHRLLTRLSLKQRQQLLTELRTVEQPKFDVPDLDPSSELLPVYIEELFRCAVATKHLEAHHFELLMETAMHFRMSESDAQQLMVNASRNHLATLCESKDVCKSLSDDQAISAAVVVGRHDVFIDAFTSVDVDASSGVGIQKLADKAAMLVLQDINSKVKRVVVVTSPFAHHGPWDSVIQWEAQPVEGYVYDDCRLTRIASSPLDSADDPKPSSSWTDVTVVVLGGTVLNRKFENRFASLRQIAE